MKWSWKPTRIAGIDVYVHATLFILIAWIGLSYWQVEGSLPAVISGIGFIRSHPTRPPLGPTAREPAAASAND